MLYTPLCVPTNKCNKWFSSHRGPLSKCCIDTYTTVSVDWMNNLYMMWRYATLRDFKLPPRR